VEHPFVGDATSRHHQVPCS